MYYRIYTADGAVQSKHSFYTHDLSLGRINANWVAPPHTAASIKRHLCKEEQLDDHITATLFDISCSSPLDDGTQISIRTGDGPGSNPEEPLALKIGPEAAHSEQFICPKFNKMIPNYYTTATRRHLTAPSWLNSFKRTERPRVPKARTRSSTSTSSESSQRAHEPRLFEIKIKAKFDGQLLAGKYYFLAYSSLLSQLKFLIPTGSRTRKEKFCSQMVFRDSLAPVCSAII